MTKQAQAMQQSPMAAPAEATAVDPVCSMTVRIAKATAAKRVSDFQGKTYYFCNDGCKEEFDTDPGKYVPAAKPK
jgi:YHS domain-containing protein